MKILNFFKNLFKSKNENCCKTDNSFKEFIESNSSPINSSELILDGKSNIDADLICDVPSEPLDVKKEEKLEDPIMVESPKKAPKKSTVKKSVKKSSPKKKD